MEDTESFESPPSFTDSTQQIPGLELTILPLQRALELAARIPVKGEGHSGTLIKVFRAVQDATQDAVQAKFRGSDLPDCSSLSKELECSGGFVHTCLTELAGLGAQNNRALLLALPLLCLAGDTDPKLKCKMVYARPGPREGTSTDMYRDEIEKRNVAALSQWVMLRRVLSAKQQKENLEEMLETRSSFSTIMQKSITKLFYVSGEKPAMSPRIVYHNFVRPIIKKLIYRGSLLYTKANLDGDILKSIYWNKHEELVGWYETLIEICNEELGADVQSFDIEDEPSDLIAAIRGIPLQNLSSLQRRIIEELYLLCHVLPARKRKEETALQNEENKRKEREMLKNAASMVLRFPRAVEKHKLQISLEEAARIAHLDEILYTKYIIGRRVTGFYLHKEKIASALMMAKRDLEHYKDPTQIHVLSAMGVHEFLDRQQIEEFQNMEEAALYESLPWYIKLFRALIKSKKLKPQEFQELKVKNKDLMQEKLELLEKGSQTKEIRRLAVEQIKKSVKKEKKDTKKGSAAGMAGLSKLEEAEAKMESKDTQADVADEEAKKITEKILEVLDRAWHSKMYPNRIYLLERVSEIDSENKLMFFMKKHCAHKVYSFFIKVDKPEYVWPIFITRRYLRRNGKKMLANIQKEIKKQKEAFMPDQERYDEIIHIEEFLEKILPKISS